MGVRIKQGDAYPICVQLETTSGEPLMQYGVDQIEFTMGEMRKLYPEEVDTYGARWEGLLSWWYDATECVIHGDGLAERFKAGQNIKIYSYWGVKERETTVVSVSPPNNINLPIGALGPGEDMFVPEAPGPVSDYVTTEDAGIYILPLTQAETFAMQGGVPLEVRVKWSDETVKGTTAAIVAVTDSQSKEIL